MTKTRMKNRVVRRRRNRMPRGSGIPSMQGTPNRVTTEFNSSIRYEHKFRFRWTTSAALNVTRARLLDLLSVAATTTTAYRVNQAVRVKSVKMSSVLAINNTTLNGPEISIEWVGIYAPSLKRTASGQGTAYPAYLHSVPPDASAPFWWSQSGGNETEILFVLSQSGTSSYTIVDVTLECVVVDDEPPTAVSIAPTGATVGTVYYAPLDGATLANFQPVGVGGNVLP